MITNHLKEVKFTKDGWIITLRSNRVIQCGLNLADALEKLDLVPQPELSQSKQILDPELEAA
jgi:hypothetical protein